MRRLVLTLVLVVGASARASIDDIESDVQTFHHHWDKFMRARYGCDKKAATTAECNPAIATFDYGEYMSARKAAKKLFGLEDK